MKLSKDIYVRVYANKFIIRRIGDETETEIVAPEPFTTKRLLVGNFSVANRLLAATIKQIIGFSLFAPRILIQPMEMVESGLSPIEVRIFTELALESGARLAFIWVGDVLTDRQVIHRLNQRKDVDS